MTDQQETILITLIYHVSSCNMLPPDGQMAVFICLNSLGKKKSPFLGCFFNHMDHLDMIIQ